MHIEVGPARRPGRTSTIYYELLQDNDLEMDADGKITLTIDATGIKDRKSRYRYRIRLTKQETLKLVRTVSQN